MKTRKYSSAWVIICAIALLAVVRFVLAQGLVTSGPPPPYDPKEPPAVSLPDAYAAVLARIGVATNRFYCVSATCLEKTLYDRGWTFIFSNTNGERARVEYYFGPKYVYIPDAKSAALLKVDKP